MEHSSFTPRALLFSGLSVQTLHGHVQLQGLGHLLVPCLAQWLPVQGGPQDGTGGEEEGKDQEKGPGQGCTRSWFPGSASNPPSPSLYD